MYNSCEDGCTVFPQKTDRHISVKVESGEREVPLDEIEKRVGGLQAERTSYL